MIENVNYNTKTKQFEIGPGGDGETIDAYTKTESDNIFAAKTELSAYETTASLTTKLNLKADKTELNGYLLKTDATTTYAAVGASYTKSESDSKYATKAELTALTTRVEALEGA